MPSMYSKNSKRSEHDSTSLPLNPENILLLWLAFFGLLVFATFWMWKVGVWHMLIEADPTFLTLVIVLVFFSTTFWCGHRSYRFAEQRAVLERFSHDLSSDADGLASRLRMQPVDRRRDWIAAYFKELVAKGPVRWRENEQLTDLLGERTHGAHDSAWWVNGIQLKLGLLGKVIGFSILALQIGSMESFDPGQSQVFLKNLTNGLGIALLTTMTGLTANILLGLQLTRLDRTADELVADALAIAETDLGRMFDGHTSRSEN